MQKGIGVAAWVACVGLAIAWLIIGNNTASAVWAAAATVIARIEANA